MSPKIKLPPEKIAELKQRQRELHDLLIELDTAEHAGLDVSIMRQSRDDAFEQISKLIEYYGPAKQ